MVEHFYTFIIINMLRCMNVQSAPKASCHHTHTYLVSYLLMS